jgi:hypothetical protein
MKKKLSKGMKKRLKKLVRKHGLEAATTLVTEFLGGLAAAKTEEPQAAPEPEAAPPPPIYPPVPPAAPAYPQAVAGD